MKPRLLHRDRDVDWEAGAPPHGDDLMTDLGLEPLLAIMAEGDGHLHDVVAQVFLTGLSDPDEIGYRQAALQDALDNRHAVTELYALARAAISSEAEVYPGLGRSASSSLHRSLQLLEAMLEVLRRVRELADSHAASFRSDAFRRFFAIVTEELDDDYFATVHEQLERLRFPGGVVVGARLGRGGRGTAFVLREPPDARGWTRRVVANVPAGATVNVSPRDRAAVKAVGELRERGMERLAASLERSAQHLHGFFEALRREVGFYVAGVRLHDALAARGPVVFPEVAPTDTPTLVTRGLVDASLLVRVDDEVIGNDVDADGKRLVLITGANQGGKSTFLRSVAIAQLSLRCGLVVAASSYRADPGRALYTHFKRGEDRTMRSGKLDEELGRLSHIVDRLEPGSIVLFNESFSSTNEHEGSQIAQDVVRALLEADVKVFLVTHGYDLAATIARDYPDEGLFLRAERQDDGGRTFRVLEGEPLPTSFGMDLYQDIFAP